MRRLTTAIAMALATWSVACGGGSSGATPTQPSAPVFQIPSGVSAPAQSMFQALPGYLVTARTDMQNLLPRNHQAASQISAKIALLQRPNLAAEMSAGRTFVEGSVISSSGQTIRIGALFPEERMRADATAAVRRIEQALPILERFTGTAFPSSTVSLWYGFVVGNTGGNAVVDMEDRVSFQSRAPPVPYDAVLDHELAHSYVGNETLTQFLELYTYNQLQGAGIEVSSWGFSRSYAGIKEDNRDSALTLDVYSLVGHDAMSRAYRAVLPLRPPYGSPLTEAQIQAFVAEAPASVKEQVLLKMSRITF